MDKAKLLEELLPGIKVFLKQLSCTLRLDPVAFESCKDKLKANCTKYIKTIEGWSSGSNDTTTHTDTLHLKAAEKTKNKRNTQRIESLSDGIYDAYVEPTEPTDATNLQHHTTDETELIYENEIKTGRTDVPPALPSVKNRAQLRKSSLVTTQTETTPEEEIDPDLLIADYVSINFEGKKPSRRRWCTIRKDNRVLLCYTSRSDTAPERTIPLTALKVSGSGSKKKDKAYDVILSSEDEAGRPVAHLKTSSLESQKKWLEALKEHDVYDDCIETFETKMKPLEPVASDDDEEDLCNDPILPSYVDVIDPRRDSDVSQISSGGTNTMHVHGITQGASCTDGSTAAAVLSPTRQKNKGVNALIGKLNNTLSRIKKKDQHGVESGQLSGSKKQISKLSVMQRDLPPTPLSDQPLSSRDEAVTTPVEELSGEGRDDDVEEFYEPMEAGDYVNSEAFSESRKSDDDDETEDLYDEVGNSMAEDCVGGKGTPATKFFMANRPKMQLPVENRPKIELPSQIKPKKEALLLDRSKKEVDTMKRKQKPPIESKSKAVDSPVQMLLAKREKAKNEEDLKKAAPKMHRNSNILEAQKRLLAAVAGTEHG